MKQKIAKIILSVLPQNKISSFVGTVGRSRLSKWYVKPYAKHYNINLKEIEKPIEEYKHLTEFFSRRLKYDARPIDEHPLSIVSPVDGVVSQVGKIRHGTIIQAKGIDYSVSSLLGESPGETGFEDGYYMTIYLSPKDYHRIHMPLEGKVTRSTYIPGRLFPVNEIGVTQVKGLFTKNERVITHIQTEAGEMAMVKVGAFIVGSVQVAYKESFKRKKRTVHKNTMHTKPYFKKGSEIGHFEFGSTVILLFQKERVMINQTIQPGAAVKMGEKIGEIIKSSR